MASASQKHRTEILHLEELIKAMDKEVTEGKRQIKSLEQEISYRDNQICRIKADFKTANEETAMKVDDVRDEQNYSLYLNKLSFYFSKYLISTQHSPSNITPVTVLIYIPMSVMHSEDFIINILHCNFIITPFFIDSSAYNTLQAWLPLLIVPMY